MAPRPVRPLETSEASFQRRLVWAAVLAAVAVGLLCFWPLLLGRHFLYTDLGNFHLPLRLFYADGLADGAIPLWLPNLFRGYFLHAEGQVGMFHPAHLLLYTLLPRGAAFALECTLAFPFTLVGMTLFLRRFRVPQAAALCGGTALGFSTFLLVRYTHVNVVAVIAHTPWLLLLVDIAARTRRARVFRVCCIGVALLVASQLLLGYPGAVVFSLIFVGLYELQLLRARRDPLRLAWLSVAGALGLMIGAVQWLPTFESFLLSNRVDASFESRFAQSLHPWNLLQPLAPYLFRQRVYQVEVPNPIEQAFYLGAASPILLTWLVVRRRDRARRAALRPQRLRADRVGAAPVGAGGDLAGAGALRGLRGDLFRSGAWAAGGVGAPDSVHCGGSGQFCDVAVVDRFAGEHRGAPRFGPAARWWEWAGRAGI